VQRPPTGGRDVTPVAPSCPRASIDPNLAAGLAVAHSLSDQPLERATNRCQRHPWTTVLTCTYLQLPTSGVATTAGIRPPFKRLVVAKLVGRQRWRSRCR
jgi:hypothetical protein